MPWLNEKYLVLYVISQLYRSRSTYAEVTPDGWGTHNSATIWTPYGVCGSSATDACATGGWDTILHSTNETTWSGMDRGIASVLYEVWGSAPDNVFAVGQNGTMRCYNGNSWGSMDSSTLIRHDGGSWSNMTSDTTNELNSVWGASTIDVVTVGANGRILHYNGSTWEPLNSGVTSALQTDWGTTSLNVYAVGQTCSIPQYNELPIPVVTAVGPSQGDQGESLTVVISGRNFIGATAADFGPGVTVSSFVIDSRTQIIVNITIAPAAEPVYSDVVAATPSGDGLLKELSS